MQNINHSWPATMMVSMQNQISVMPLSHTDLALVILLHTVSVSVEYLLSSKANARQILSLIAAEVSTRMYTVQSRFANPPNHLGR